MTKTEKLSGTVFLAFPEMKNLLVSELNDRFGLDVSEFESTACKWFGDLLYLPDFTPQKDEKGGFVLPYWARTCCLNPFILHFDSIGEAASELKKIQRNWAPYQ